MIINSDRRTVYIELCRDKLITFCPRLKAPVKDRFGGFKTYHAWPCIIVMSVQWGIQGA